MNKERLIKVAEFLEKLQKKEDETKRSVFDFCCVAYPHINDADMLRENRVNKDNLFDCGSVFCACGLLPIIDPKSGIHWYRDGCLFTYNVCDTNGNIGYVDVASNYFDISKDDSSFLFTSGSQHRIKNWGHTNVCNDDATAKEVADAIRHFIAIKEQAA